ncbi:MAG: ATP-binding protein [Lachnospiraceae bacterium]|nr:ATP-binding protein [Lachnospiraceae bacterium]
MSNSCTGATGPDKEHLAMYRVEKPGCLNIFTMPMDADQRIMRRAYLRKALLPYERFANLSNEELDAIRLRPVEGGYLLEDSHGYDFFLKSSGVTDSEREFRRTYAMMPFEFINVTAADFKWDKYREDTKASKELVSRYIVKFPQFKERGMGLYIYSVMKGSGKTMLACCLLNEIVKRYAGSVKFINILDFLEMTKKGFRGEDKDVQVIRQTGLLVVDDIGVQLDKEWIGTVLYQLINERYVNRLPTIYTSNIPPEHLKLDDRITDRIESTTFAVKLPEESIRRETRQQDKRRLLEEIENAP